MKPVSIPEPPQRFRWYAEIAQLVEHDLAKVGVASSSLVFRSRKRLQRNLEPFFVCLFSPNPRRKAREGDSVTIKTLLAKLAHKDPTLA